MCGIELQKSGEGNRSKRVVCRDLNEREKPPPPCQGVSGRFVHS